MALETLKDVTEIDGFEVTRDMVAIGSTQEVLFISDEKNIISFKIQSGPVGPNGVNGCQVDTIIETAKIILIGLDKKFPSEYNDKAIGGLNAALLALKARKADREERGVEGENKE